MPDKNRLTYLFQQYLSNNITDSELEELFEYVKQVRTDETLKAYITSVYQETRAETDEEGRQIDWDTMFDSIVHESLKAEAGTEETTGTYGKRFPLWRSIAAAVVLLIIGVGVYFYRHKAELPQEIVRHEEKKKRDIMPGGNKATLTLANGMQLVLDSTQKGTLAGQGNMKVLKLGSGRLAYQSGALKKGNEKLSDRGAIAYNTLTTPRGGQYQLTLSDGTKVWLNSGSSIRYPVAFKGKKRKVEMTGEVYFEVKHDEDKPFKVWVNGEVIEDIGTHFNVNAYADEPAMRTTLLEGAVKVRKRILKPGEQAVLENGKMKVLENINTDNIVAWKNGYFAFNDATLAMVMRKLARWYDIEVVYREGVDSEQRFSGRIGRDLTLSQVLNGLRQTSAHFKIEADRRRVILQ